VRLTATDEGDSVTATSPVTILLAEDSPIYRRLIGTHLAEWGLEFVCAEDGKEAWKCLGKPDAPRLALLDWVLPDIDGIEICRRLRSRAADIPYTYVIVLTAKGRKQEMLEAMEAGADDFLAKPFDLPELKARILVGKRIVELQQKLVSANNALHFAACHDFLTGIWNRAEILGFLRRELARARRDGTPVGIVLADVDHFKKVNDAFGHEAGDFVLKEIARRLASSLREYDGVGRYGGEEFLLVIPGCDLATTVRRANQVKELVSSQPIHTPTGVIDITLSMGVTDAKSSGNLEELVSHADLALYQAKHNGRNRVEFQDAALHVSAQRP
jgi:two-component system, cell cycle response regulator